MYIALAVLMILHGLIHLMGFVKAFNLAELKEITQDISRPMGMLWLATMLVFSAAGTALLLGQTWWWPITIASIVLSQIVIALHFKEAKWGTIANVLILAGLILILTEIV
jgi:hypothetical protein